MPAVKSPMIIDRIFGAVLAIMIVAAAICLFRKLL